MFTRPESHSTARQNDKATACQSPRRRLAGFMFSGKPKLRRRACSPCKFTVSRSHNLESHYALSWWMDDGLTCVPITEVSVATCSKLCRTARLLFTSHSSSSPLQHIITASSLRRALTALRQCRCDTGVRRYGMHEFESLQQVVQSRSFRSPNPCMPDIDDMPRFGDRWQDFMNAPSQLPQDCVRGKLMKSGGVRQKLLLRFDYLNTLCHASLAERPH